MTRDDQTGTFAERARREQLLGVTVEQVAARGIAGASLSRIAEAAGITKAAVLYHFGSKDTLIAAAHAHVLESLVTAVGSAVDAADPVDRPAAYVRGMIAHLGENPRHTGVLVAVAMEGADDHTRPERWGPLAGLLEDASAAGGERLTGAEARALAVIVGGAIDGIVAERIDDGEFDLDRASDLLVGLLRSYLDRPAR